MAKKAKNSKFSKKIFYLILGGFVVKALVFIFKRSGKKEEIGHNFRSFLKKERQEFVEFAKGEESGKEYVKDSLAIFTDFFIPNHRNEHKPKILHTRSLVTIAVFLIAVKVVISGYLFLSYPNQAQMSEEIINKVVELVNRDRAAEGLKPLAYNSALSVSAKSKASDLVEKDYFAHYSPDGRKPWDFINRDNYKYLFVGENLAMNFTAAETVHRALMNSPSHRKNIMNERYDDIGMAMMSGEINGKNTNVLVQFFATEKATQLAVAEPPVSIAATEPEPQEETIEPVVEPSETQVQPTEEETVPAQPVPVEETQVENVNPETVARPVRESIVAAAATPTPATTEEEILGTQTSDIIKTSSQVAAVKPKLVQKELVPVKETVIKEPEAPEPVFFQTSVSPNPDIDNFNLIIPEKISNTEERFEISSAMVRMSNYLFLLVLIAMGVILAINIFVRVRVQHRSVIVQTLLLLVLVSGLLYLRLHHLESGVTEMLIL